VQSRLLGADDVHIVYRRGPDKMSASAAEVAWAQQHGVAIHHPLAPAELLGNGGHVDAVRFAHTGGGADELFAADMVFKAIGQKLAVSVLDGAGLRIEGGRVLTDADGATGVPGVWAGGDCRAGGRDLTVEAVEDGKLAALSIHLELSAA
jgi:dihydropyrimidine dehydrogenase (NAD+) subunit PreT